MLHCEYVHNLIVAINRHVSQSIWFFLFNSSSSAGLKESPRMPLADSVLLTEIMDEIRKQVGVAFSQDSQWHHSKAGAVSPDLNLLGWNRGSCSGQALAFWYKQITHGSVWQSLSRRSVTEATVTRVTEWAATELKIQSANYWNITSWVHLSLLVFLILFGIL